MSKHRLTAYLNYEWLCILSVPLHLYNDIEFERNTLGCVLFLEDSFAICFAVNEILSDIERWK